MGKNIVEIYFKGDKKKTVAKKVRSEKDLAVIRALAKSEIFRSSELADIDYDDIGALRFKIDGDKVSPQELIKICDKALRSINDDMPSSRFDRHGYDDDDEPKKKKKDKDKKKGKGKNKKKKKKHDDDDDDYYSVSSKDRDQYSFSGRVGYSSRITETEDDDECIDPDDYHYDPATDLFYYKNKIVVKRNPKTLKRY